jgi:putative heme-binding domain-containing protein
MIVGQGGLGGPDLSNIGAERSLAALAKSIQRPGNSERTGYQHVRISTLDGQTIDGMIKNDSGYSIQILDMKGDFHFFPKSDLAIVTYYQSSLMPPADLSNQELQDILAFLSSQKLQAMPTPSSSFPDDLVERIHQ